MSDQKAQREMSLQEWVETLPPDHRARKEHTQLEEENEKSRDHFIELFEYICNFEPFKTWIKKIDALKESD